MRQRLREEMQIEFTLMDGELRVLDAVRRAALGPGRCRHRHRLADLEAWIDRDEALRRIPPNTLNQLLHRQVCPLSPNAMS